MGVEQRVRPEAGREQILSPRIDHSYLFERLSSVTTDDGAEFFLGKVTRQFYRIHVKGENPLLTSVKELLRQEGYHPNPRSDYASFYEVIENLGIPLGKMPMEMKNGPQKGTVFYHFVLAKDAERVISGWARKTELQKFKESSVKHLETTEGGEVPNTRELVDYGYVGGVAKRLKIPFTNRSKIRREDLLKGCPVSISIYDERFRYPKSREQELEEFLERRYDELAS